jgi:parallel beta-helix repeat protein
MGRGKMPRKLTSGTVLGLLLISLLHVGLNVRNASSWSNGGFSSDPNNPVYGTHDWIAQHALDWLPAFEKNFITDNLNAYLYGTELPDNGGAPDGIGDTVLHHVYYWSNQSLQDDASAARARTEYFNALNYYRESNYSMAAKTLGIMSHYIVDVSVFGHVMAESTDWGEEVHHSDYETYVDGGTDNYFGTFNSYLSFDGSLDLCTAYSATLSIAYDTTFGGYQNLSCTWMDANYNWSNPVFKNRAGQSLNLAVNYLADVLHRFHVETLIPRVQNINTGRNFTAVQDAIDHETTLNGHALKVFPSIYYENVVVHKSVAIVGEERSTTAIDGNFSGGIVVSVTASNVNIRNLTVENSGSWLSFGILMNFTQGNIVESSVLLNNALAIYLNSSSDNSIVANRILSNGDGVGLRNSPDNNITGNYVANCHGLNAGGGMWLWKANCTGNRITENTVTGSTLYAMGFSQWASNNLIHHNNFVNNSAQIHFDDNTTANTWDDGYPSGGNYWSDHTASDAFRGMYQNETGFDGICDTAYAIGAGNADHYPLMGFFGPSTPTGANVTVFPISEVGLVFENVTIAGWTTASKGTAGPPPPVGFISVGQYFDVQVMAQYSGSVSVRITYDSSNMTPEEENSLQLLQWYVEVCDVTSNVTGVPDGICNMRDIGYFASKFMTNSTSPNWDPRCDVTGPAPNVPDGIVNMRDIGMAATHFGSQGHWINITLFVDPANDLLFGETTHFSLIGIHKGE